MYEINKVIDASKNPSADNVEKLLMVDGNNPIKNKHFFPTGIILIA